MQKWEVETTTGISSRSAHNDANNNDDDANDDDEGDDDQHNILVRLQLAIETPAQENNF